MSADRQSPMSGEPARNVVLQRIRSALDGGSQISGPGDVVAFHSEDRRYEHATEEQRLSLFEERIRDYDAEIERASVETVAEVVARCLRGRGDPRIVMPDGFPVAWQPHGCRIEMDRMFSARELDAFDGVLTGATLGIAETGTLVLQAVPGQGRRALSLVPDLHVCVVRAADIVSTVPEAMARLAATASLPTTFISGPSATADIEMTRIKGVHGPRLLHVVLVRGEQESR